MHYIRLTIQSEKSYRRTEMVPPYVKLASLLSKSIMHEPWSSSAHQNLEFMPFVCLQNPQSRSSITLLLSSPTFSRQVTKLQETLDGGSRWQQRTCRYFSLPILLPSSVCRLPSAEFGGSMSENLTRNKDKNTLTD